VGPLEQHMQTLAVGGPQLDLNWPVAKLHTTSFGMLCLTNGWPLSGASALIGRSIGKHWRAEFCAHAHACGNLTQLHRNGKTSVLADAQRAVDACQGTDVNVTANLAQTLTDAQAKNMDACLTDAGDGACMVGSTLNKLMPQQGAATRQTSFATQRKLGNPLT